MPITKSLFGDDLAKDVKACDSMSFIGKSGMAWKRATNVERSRSLCSLPATNSKICTTNGNKALSRQALCSKSVQREL
ncbi:hypothetical protein DPMN_081022 [Dreissena polymorpha]|uniref:Uncharacterized protein n=1 Tax=Dreissena polymorpha TaxID=45954 RepID=A0A9D3Y470_DREPO|nr:hypothetical protein DPMN_081022 [Dreissena polymorpha]